MHDSGIHIPKIKPILLDLNSLEVKLKGLNVTSVKFMELYKVKDYIILFKILMGNIVMK